MRQLKVLREGGALWAKVQFFIVIMMFGYTVGGVFYIFSPTIENTLLEVVFVLALVSMIIYFFIECGSGVFHRIILDISDKGLRYPTFFPFIFKKITWDEIDSVIYEPINGRDGWADGDIIIYVSESAKGKYKTTKVQNYDTKEVIKVKTIVINTKEAVLSGNKIYPVILNNLKKSRKKVKVDFSKKI
ncbi:MAG: hypothetical protein ACRCTZ_10850 [Sarcina sp.]